jgi:hypothetical protein
MINKSDKKEIMTKESILKPSKKAINLEKEESNNKVEVKEDPVKQEIELKDNKKTKETIV